MRAEGAWRTEEIQSIVTLFFFFRITETSDLSNTTKSSEGPEDERDYFTFCLLAADKENADEYKVI